MTDIIHYIYLSMCLRTEIIFAYLLLDLRNEFEQKTIISYY